LQDAWIAYENNPGPTERDALEAGQNELNGLILIANFDSD